MSKNIIIQKDGVAQNVTAAKLSTNELGGGSCTWVPEDEANDYASFGSLSATENGTYIPDENQAGYNSVTVNVQKKLAPIMATENGIYYANEQGVDGFSSVKVNVPSISNISMGVATENGVYDAAENGLDGYKPFRVMVQDFAATITDPEDPTKTKEVEIHIPEIPDPGQLPIAEITIPDLPDYTIDPVSGISSIATIDPLTGTLTGDVISVDTEGNVITSTIPVSMSITTPPTKTSYTEGEVIDYRGIVCTLYNKDGTVFTNERYPDGNVPMSELEYPVSMAPAGSGDITVDEDVGLKQPFPYSSGGYARTENVHHVYSVTDGRYTMWMINTQLYKVAASDKPNQALVITDERGTSSRFELSSSYTKNGKTVYYVISVGTWSASLPEFSPHAEPNGSPISAEEIAWTMVYDGMSGQTSIPVLWPNNLTDLSDVFPVRLKFRDTFEIEVTNNE